MQRKGMPDKPMMWNLCDVEESRKFLAYTIIVKPGPVEIKYTHITNHHGQNIPLDRACPELVFNAVGRLLHGNHIYH